MTIPAILQKVTKGESRLPSKEYMEKCLKIRNEDFYSRTKYRGFAILLPH